MIETYNLEEKIGWSGILLLFAKIHEDDTVNCHKKPVSVLIASLYHDALALAGNNNDTISALFNKWIETAKMNSAGVSQDLSHEDDDYKRDYFNNAIDAYADAVVKLFVKEHRIAYFIKVLNEQLMRHHNVFNVAHK